MSQNIYDTTDFFEQYSKYPRAIDGLNGASEWPLLKALLPEDLTSLTVLDLGCGDGWFSRWAADQGGKSVIGLDVSKNMLDRARGLTSSDAVEYRQVDMQNLSLAENAVDLVFSGLALHYASNLDEVLEQVHKSLRAGGSFVFSVEHPVFTAPRRPGFDRDELTGRTFWPLNDYFTEGNRAVIWLGAKVKKQHHTLASWVKGLRRAGFSLVGMDEWGVTEEESRKHPNWPNEGVIPRFLLISSRKSLRTGTMTKGVKKSSRLRGLVGWARRGVLLSRRLRMKGT